MKIVHGDGKTKFGPGVFYVFPLLLLQRDPKGPVKAHRPPPDLMIFIGWLVWEWRIDLDL